MFYALALCNGHLNSNLPLIFSQSLKEALVSILKGLNIENQYSIKLATCGMHEINRKVNKILTQKRNI